MSSGLIGLSTKTLRSVAPSSTWAASYLRPSSAAFITTIAESSFQYTQGLADLVRPDFETDQRVGAEGVGDRHVSRIAPLSNQHAADSRHVIARIECVPPPAKIGLEPAGEIHWAIGRWHADVPEIAGAIARRNVHAAAERDGEVRVVATHTLAFIEDLPGRHSRARMLVAEGDVAMDEIADRLDARPPRWRLFEEVPGHLGQALGLAVATAEEKD